HIVSDGWSLGIVLHELGALYRGCAAGDPPVLEAPVLQYADYTLWQNESLQGERLQREVEYWRDLLGDAPSLLALPTDRRRPAVQDPAGADLDFEIAPALAAAIKNISRKNGGTPFMTCLAAWALVMSRLSGQANVVVGTPVANRPMSELENVVGLFVNTLAIPLDIATAETPLALLSQTKDRVLSALEHQALPFDLVVERINPQRSLAYSPLFQTMFAWQDPPATSLAWSETVCVEPLGVGAPNAKFDLSLFVTDNDGLLECSIEYATALFDEATVLRFAGYFVEALRAMTEAPDSALSGLRLHADASPGEYGERREYDLSVPAHAYFERHAAERPDAPALVWGLETFAYGDLNLSANRLAHHLRALGVAPDVLVGICAQRSPAMALSVLAILKAGGAYLPLDPEHPAQRLAGMIEDARPRVVLADEAGKAVLAKAFAGMTSPPLVLDPVADETAWRDADPGNPDRLAIGLHSNHLAYVIYTSGSTGKPKGVMVEHSGLANYLQFAREAYLPGPITGGVVATPLGFDATLTTFMAPWLAGRPVLLLPNALSETLSGLLALFASERPWLFKLTPAHLDALSELSTGVQANTPHILVVGGEQLTAATVRRFRERVLPGAVFVNEYGPTETVVGCTTRTLMAGDALHEVHAVAIGRPTANMTVYLLGAHGNPALPGAIGEVHIAGAQMARGYLGRTDLTTERFLSDPFSTRNDARMYRTGDLARRLPDGQLEYVGRNDAQIKIRGYRIELGEIEAALARCAGVLAAVVLAREDVAGDKTLVAYFEPAGETAPEVDSLRAELASALPDYMVPSIYIRVETWPLTRNGKLDRDALPPPGRDAHDKPDQSPPRDDTERALLAIWQRTLKRDAVGIHDNFFGLGGHSLLAVQLISRIRAEMRMELTLRSVFEAPTIARMAVVARAAATDLGQSPAVAPRAAAGQVLPLTSAQSQLWLFERLRPAAAAYNVGGAYRLRGALDADALERAFQRLVRRHDALRMMFAERMGRPVQVVQEHADMRLLRTASASVAPQIREAEARRFADEMTILPFDLARPPLLRAALLRFEPDDHVLAICSHHIVSDAWSSSVLYADLWRFYAIECAGGTDAEDAASLGFADIVLQESGDAFRDKCEADIRHWKGALAGTSGLLDLPIDKPRPEVLSASGARWTGALAGDLRDALHALASNEGATLFMALLAVFQSLLSRYTGDADVVVGTPVSRRTAKDRENVVGMLLNTLAMRADFSRDPSFRECLARTRESCLQAFDHADAPIESVIERLRIDRAPGRSPLFQTMFVLRNDGDSSADIECADLRASWIEPAVTTSRFELTCDILECRDGMALTIDYSTDLFVEGTIAQLGAHFESLLRAAVADPDRPLSRLPILSAEETDALLTMGYGGPAEVETDATLHGLFAAQAARTPQADALVEPGRCVSYAEALARANGIGCRLLEIGATRETIVAVLTDRSVDAVLGVLGAHAAGAAYLPLDPTSPDERLQFLLQDANASALLVPATQRARAEALMRALRERDGDASLLPMIALDEVPPSHEAPAVERRASDAAYVIYTSGSTGQPKGVLVEHRGAVNLVRGFLARHEFADQRLLMIPPLIFDASVGDIFPALACGSALVLHPNPTELGAAELERFCDEYRVTAIDAPAALWRRWSEGLAARGAGPHLPHLRLMMIGGESVPIEQVRRFAQITERRAVLCNHYGPTEASVCATLLPTIDGAELGERPSSDLPIGRPLPGVYLYVLDAYGALCPRSVVGELYIGGLGVARGYLGASALTDERFVRDASLGVDASRMYRTGDLVRWNADGTLQFVGRRDHQIKLRGVRIELGEIEAALAVVPGVQMAAVLLREDRPGDKRLVAYVVANADTDASPTSMRAGLAQRLPDAMMPSAYVFLDAMPLNANGKIDRRALPPPGEDDARERAIVAPRTATEETVLAVWREVLG
ncbi:MAG: amino acid adenylation domain-containing protein, partial [Xanthomonadaceae bacterium]|nr:amino acid adenylation domain-containing protein [Xanthomonadaceae bacterium]